MANGSPSPFGVLLKRYRVAALLTQEELAARAQLSADTVRALERGKRQTPRYDSARLLANALALTSDERKALLAAATPPSAATPGQTRPTPARRVTGRSQPRQATRIAQPSVLFGRETELALIRQRLLGEGEAEGEAEGARARLLTLTGPAGVGKTRLALAATAQLGDHFADGALVVDLTPIRDPRLVAPRLARAIGLTDTGPQPLAERLSAFLRDRTMLLTLDNFEQALPAAGAVGDLLAQCPRLTLLVTSRIPLRLRWEWTLRVAPLPTPDLSLPLPPLDALTRIPALALFAERARARRADFTLTASVAPLVARLVSELDGLPLALELAAARLDALSLAILAQRLSDRLRLLRWEAVDLPERQRSLEAAIGWSYDLLSAPEQRLFRCLGVFTGQVTPAAIAAVSAATAGSPPHQADEPGGPDATGESAEADALDGLISLTEKSLALSTPHDDQESEETVGSGERPGGGPSEPVDGALEPRFTMLETMREYAWERLERLGALTAARHAHARYFLALAERADPLLRGARQLAWYSRLERERDNLRAALHWLVIDTSVDATAEGSEAGLRLATALGWFWWTRGYIREGARWLGAALARAPDAPTPLRARAMRQMGVMIAYAGDFSRASDALDEALTLAYSADDAGEIAQARAYQGLSAVYSGDAACGMPQLREALRQGQNLGDPHLLGMIFMFLGAAAYAQGDEEDAMSDYVASRERFEAAGDRLFAVNVQLNLAWFAWRHGAIDAAVNALRAGLAMGVAARNKRLLSFSAQTALALVSDSDVAGSVNGADHGGSSGGGSLVASLAERARLLGAVDALHEAAGMTLMQTVTHARLARLRENVSRAGREAEYREGRALSLIEVSDLALTLVERLPQTPRVPSLQPILRPEGGRE